MVLAAGFAAPGYGAAAASGRNLARFAAIEAAPVTTFIYVGTVRLSAGTFHRESGGYLANYAAKVFPYFFYNEHGRLWIDFSDADLARIAAGKPVDFTGRGIRSDGVIRPIDGCVTPTGDDGGRIHVRIHVGRHLVLAFESTYRLAGQGPEVKASGTR
jgi:hypothetical protein